MIDTDKYEGHTPAPWKWIIDDKDTYLSCFDNDIKADENLIADAPLLLAEIKKMRGFIKNSLNYIKSVTRISDTVKLKFLINDLQHYVLREGDEQE